MARAILRRFRESPRKVRAVADMIRGRSVEDAMSILRMQQRKAAVMLVKVLDSAIANAAENDKADPDTLVVKSDGSHLWLQQPPTDKAWKRHGPPRLRPNEGRQRRDDTVPGHRHGLRDAGEARDEWSRRFCRPYWKRKRVPCPG